MHPNTKLYLIYIKRIEARMRLKFGLQRCMGTGWESHLYKTRGLNLKAMQHESKSATTSNVGK